MSTGNLFYSNVDQVLQSELNARGAAGRSDRSNAAIDYMLGKIANVTATAYDTTSSRSTPIATLGGSAVREGRYRATAGGSGFLENSTYTTSSVTFSYGTDGETVTGATISTSEAIRDTTYRPGPFIKGVSIDIGDHSMGLLNSATLNITIPNPQRDLDFIEEMWFRPGRYVKLELTHPDSAVITGAGNRISKGIPNRDRVKELYPDWPVDDLLNQISRLNVFNFEGLIVSFEFSYDTSMQVEATINLRGTSNSYTDISMYLPPIDKKQETKIKSSQKSIADTQNTGLNAAVLTKQDLDNKTPPKFEFYDTLYTLVNTEIQKIDPESKQIILTPFKFENNNKFNDHYILAGSPYPSTVNDDAVAAYTEQIRAQATASINEVTGSNSAERIAQITANANAQIKFIEDEQAAEKDVNIHYHRYITLGALIHYINTYVIKKKIVNYALTGVNSSAAAQIICDDNTCFSNYLPEMTSCDPHNILLLPQTDVPDGMNYYGNTVFYQTATAANSAWPGIYQTTLTSGDGVMYPSRIFINLTLIEKICNSLSQQDTKNFTVNSFLSVLSAKINYATGGFVRMNLVTDPDTTSTLLYADTRNLKSSKQAPAPYDEPVTPYSVPMGANHINGTIVKNFNFSAQLPENAKNLSYVLNQGEEVSEYDIAPYINFMYNTKDPKKLQQIIDSFKEKNTSAIDTLRETKRKLGAAPTEPQLMQGLYSALNTYVKYPTGNIKQSQIMVAPIFPFSVDFTIDGINGFKYGDVLTFELLPLKYRVNTVFSIIGIQHKVEQNGIWETTVKCIMRPRI